MRRNPPGTPDLQPGALSNPPRLSGRSQQIAATFGLKIIPRLPARAKQLLSAGGPVLVDGNTLDPTLQLVVSAMRMAGVDGYGLAPDDSPTAPRTQIRELSAALPGPQIQVAVSDLPLPGPAGDIPARHYRPACAEPTPLLVFYHGGGWVIGGLDTHDQLCRLTCRDAGIHVLSIDYRLAPEHPAPAAVDDAYAAFRWAHEHAGDLGAIPGRVAIGGDSAGGNLAAVVSQLARDDDGPAPVLQLLIYPLTDFTAQTRSLSRFANGFLLTKQDIDWFAAQYLGRSGVEATDPRVSPLLAKSLSGLPPTLISVAGFDPLRDEGELYATALRAAGNEVDLRRMRSLTHGFANLFPLGGGSAIAVAELISALRAHLSRN